MPFDFDSVDTGDTAWVLASAALVLLMTPAWRSSTAAWSARSTSWPCSCRTSSPSASSAWSGCCAASPSPSAEGNGFIGDLHFAGLQHMGEHDPGLRGQLRAGHPADGLRGLPADVRHHHPGADHRRRRRPDEVRRVRAVHRALVDPRLRARRALGVRARRLAVPARRARLRRRHGRAHQRRRRRPGAGDRARQAARAGRRSRCGPHNLPFVLLGAGLLWFGWFGFNAGSALAANEPRRRTRSSTPTPPPRAALLGWIVVE